MSDFWLGGDVPLAAIVVVIMAFLVTYMAGWWPPRPDTHAE